MVLPASAVGFPTMSFLMVSVKLFPQISVAVKVKSTKPKDISLDPGVYIGFSMEELLKVPSPPLLSQEIILESVAVAKLKKMVMIRKYLRQYRQKQIPVL